MSGARLKRLRYRAWHRGTKELDLILGRFADREVEGMGAHDLDAFEALLDEPDPSIYGWVVRDDAPPDPFRALIERLRASLAITHRGDAT